MQIVSELTTQRNTTQYTNTRSATTAVATSNTSMKLKGAVVALVVAVAVAATGVHGAVTCANVDASLLPCVGYLTGKKQAPSDDCCAGVKQLRAMPTNTAERRFACECVKKAAAHYQNLKNEAVHNLPGACGVSLPFPISLTLDCTTIP